MPNRIILLAIWGHQNIAYPFGNYSHKAKIIRLAVSCWNHILSTSKKVYYLTAIFISIHSKVGSQWFIFTQIWPSDIFTKQGKPNTNIFWMQWKKRTFFLQNNKHGKPAFSISGGIVIDQPISIAAELVFI